jgi:hypothetical protein
MFNLFDAREVRRVDLVETSAEAREGTEVAVDRRAAQILQQVVVYMDSVQARLGGMNLIQVR